MRFRLNLPQPVIPLFWGLFLLEATFGSYFAIWPLWIEELGAPIKVVGLVLGSAGFIRLFVIFPAATIADRFGYRRTIMVARSIAIAGLLSAAVATEWWQLFIMVIAGAIGEMVFPLIQTLVATEAGDDRIRAFALVFNVGPSVALIIAPLASSVLVAAYGMRAAFIFGAILSVFSLYFLRQILEPPLDVIEAHETSPTYAATLRHSAVQIITGILFLTIFVLSMGVSFIPTFLEDVRGFAPSTIAAMGALPAIGSAAFGLAVSRLPKLQRSPFVTASVAVAGTGAALLIFRSTAIIPLLILAFLLRGGLFSTWATMAGVLGDRSPRLLRSRAFALLEMAGGVAFSLGPIVAGILYATNPTLPFEVAAVAAFLLIPVFALAQRRMTAVPRDPDSGSRPVAVLPLPVEDPLPESQETATLATERAPNVAALIGSDGKAEGVESASDAPPSLHPQTEPDSRLS